VSLDRFFAPASVAVVGASPERTKIRGALLHILRANGFPGAIYPVNPSYREIDGLACFASVAMIGQPVDLAVIAVPAPGVPKALEDCAAAGVLHAVVISSGFAEEGAEKSGLQEEIRAIAARTGMRVSGPNAEGFHNELGHVSVTFSPTVERREAAPTEITGKRIGIIAQSGGMGFALYNRGRALGLPFSYVVSTGNEVDLSAADFFAHMVEDPATGVVLMFLESIRDPIGFVSAAGRAAALGKPVIAVKVGASPAGERATASHTASMAGWDTAYRAAFKRFGIVEAADPDEAVAIAAALSTCPRAAGRRTALVTVSGGAGAWSADVLAAAGLELPELSSHLQTAITAEIPSYGSARNPVDVTAQAVYSGGLAHVIDMLIKSPEIDVIAIILALSNESRVAIGGEALKKLVASSRKPLLFYSYTLPSALAKQVFGAAGVVIQSGLRELGAAARALTLPAPVPWSAASWPDHTAALPADRSGMLAEYETKRILTAWGIEMPVERLVRDAVELEDATAVIGFPVALKIQSPDLPHKTEIGGVVLGLRDLATAAAAHRHMLDRIARQHPSARIDGVLVQPMARPGVEMIVGVIRDPTFGPLVTVGGGGITTEIYRDLAHRLAPVDDAEVLAMLRELACWKLLDGFRGKPPADVAAFVRLVVAVSHFAWACRDRVQEIELNPVMVHAVGEGTTAIDALLTLSN
jgi:acyl-CoA synthetase (NDP forming)